MRIRSFIRIRDERIRGLVASYLDQGLLWPNPLIQLNPSFQYAGTIDDLISAGVLHQENSRVFRTGKERGIGKPLRLYQHQADAIQRARAGRNYVLTTGTGSGKSLSYIVPIVDHVLRNGSGRGIQAIVVYPMNALANSQFGELKKFLKHGYPDEKGPVTFARYTGQEKDEERNAIVANPPDILLTNYVMLELILTRVYEKQLVRAAQGLRFLVLDELHTYRGRQGADVALLVRRARELFGANQLQIVGTSATLAGPGTYGEQQREIAAVASVLFGAEVAPSDVIGETLRRATTEVKVEDSRYIASLRQRVEDPDSQSPQKYAEFASDPLSSWIESAFGIYRDQDSDRLRRRKPRTITGHNGAASELKDLIGISQERAEEVIKEALLAGYTCEPNPETGFPAFAFRLHQFISRGDTVYASLEPEYNRFLTFNRQQFVPGDRSRVLIPMVFCRECGQEYYCVRRQKDPESGIVAYLPRELSDRSGDDNSDPGFLFFSTEYPWPSGMEDELAKLPEDWLEETNQGARVSDPPGPDLCENCQSSLELLLTPMLRLQNVSTRRKDKINSDEEERLRLGYETLTGPEEGSGTPEILPRFQPRGKVPPPTVKGLQ